MDTEQVLEMLKQPDPLITSEVVEWLIGEGLGVIEKTVRMEHLLEQSMNGLLWWMDNYPEDVSSADYEHVDKIKEVLGIA